MELVVVFFLGMLTGYLLFGNRGKYKMLYTNDPIRIENDDIGDKDG